MMGVKAELSGQNHHLNPIEAHVFEEGMTDLLRRREPHSSFIQREVEGKKDAAFWRNFRDDQRH